MTPVLKSMFFLFYNFVAKYSFCIYNHKYSWINFHIKCTATTTHSTQQEQGKNLLFELIINAYIGQLILFS
jgi:hypothetical protein